MFLSNNFGGVVQEMIIEDEDKQLLALINRELATYITNMDHGRFLMSFYLSEQLLPVFVCMCVRAYFFRS